MADNTQARVAEGSGAKILCRSPVSESRLFAALVRSIVMSRRPLHDRRRRGWRRQFSTSFLAIVLSFAVTPPALAETGAVLSPLNSGSVSSPPSSHKISYDGHFAMDVAGSGDVFARLSSSASVALRVERISAACAEGRQGGAVVRLRAYFNGAPAALLVYSHLADVGVSVGQTLGNGARLGRAATGLPRDERCWTGAHVHFEARNDSSFACYMPLPTGARVSADTAIGRIGTVGATGVRQPCSGSSGSVSDGDLIRTPNGNIYRIVGGAPLHLSRCDYTNGCANVVHVANLDGFQPFPRDGALAANVDDGGIYRFAGGAPLWISSCAYSPGCGGVVQIDSHAFNANDHMRAQPADGTLVANHADGGIYRFAGGAPLWISSCAYAPGCGSVVQVDGGTFSRNGAISGPPRMRNYPVDNTLIANHADGGIYRFAGGAPLWIASCGYAPGCGSVVQVDGGTFSRNGAISGDPRMTAYPLNGTYLRIGASHEIRRAAGGAALTLTDCSVLDGACANPIAIDAGTLERHGAISGAPRLRATPTDGTVLHARPSDMRWTIASGKRTPAPLRTSGVQVNDATVAAFARPVLPVPAERPNGGNEPGRPGGSDGEDAEDRDTPGGGNEPRGGDGSGGSSKISARFASHSVRRGALLRVTTRGVPNRRRITVTFKRRAVKVVVRSAMVRRGRAHIRVPRRIGTYRTTVRLGRRTLAQASIRIR